MISNSSMHDASTIKRNKAGSPRRRSRNNNKNKSHHPCYPRIEPFNNDESHHSELLEQALYDRGLYESAEGLEKRSAAFGHLEELLNRWSCSLRPFGNVTTDNNVERQKGSGKKIERPRVALISFGSYRLGVHRPDADLDLLALCPPNCTRGDFFTSLVKLLKEDNERVEGVHPIPGAYTPVIKFTLNGLSVDLLFARVTNPTKLLRHSKGDTYYIDDSDLKDVDEAGVRSLNGSRAAQTLLLFVPDVEQFRTTLRAVKEWAVVHGLYSNVLGFLGGINYALLVAAICKQHPHMKPASLLKIFFETFAEWQWPTPVAIKRIQYDPPPGVSPLAVWNINNSRDRTHLMPILTPNYPTMNSSYNVGVPQLRRIAAEFKKASKIVAAIELGDKEWKDLFRGSDFFTEHMHFLRVDIVAADRDSFHEWFRFVESRLRLLFTGLEAPMMGSMQVVPFAKFFDDTTTDKNGRKTSMYTALRFGEGMESVDLTFLIADVLRKIEAWDGRTTGMTLNIEHVKKENLPQELLQQGEEDVGEEINVAPKVLSYAAMVRGEVASATAMASPAKRPRT